MRFYRAICIFHNFKIAVDKAFKAFEENINPHFLLIFWGIFLGVWVL
jgi:hypothetical protein